MLGNLQFGESLAQALPRGASAAEKQIDRGSVVQAGPAWQCASPGGRGQQQRAFPGRVCKSHCQNSCAARNSERSKRRLNVRHGGQILRGFDLSWRRRPQHGMSKHGNANTAMPLVTSASLGTTAPLILPSDHWGVWAVLLSAAAGGLWMERGTTLGKALSAPLVSTLIALVLSNAGVIPSDAPAYTVVNKFLMPLAVPLLLMGADLRRVFRETGRLLFAFCIGAVGTVVGTLVAVHTFPLTGLGPDGWKIATALMSRHIGGAVNYVAVCEALGASSSIVASGLAADNLICAIYFSFLFLLASKVPAEATTTPTTVSPGATAPNEEGRAPIDVFDGSAALAFSAVVCCVGVALARRLNFLGGGIPCITAVAVALATLFPSVLSRFAVAGEGLSVILMQIFFATIGANGSVASVVRDAPTVFLFCFLQLAVHLAFILGAGKLLGFERRELLLASNANVGGPTTAGGMATSKGWRSLLVPSILVGIFGYSIATFLSLFIGAKYLRYV